MAFEGDIQDQAHQTFCQEALDFLQEIEGALLAFSQDRSSAQIDILVQVADNLKDKSARFNWREPIDRC